MSKIMLLGLFNTQAYEENQQLCDPFPWTTILLNEPCLQKQTNSYNENFDILFKQAIEKSEQIRFLLDGIRLPLKDDSFTTKELNYILSNVEIKNKTEFILHDDSVNIDEFLTAK